MFITVHAAAGALIGTQISNPIIAFIVGFISHLLLDIIPHGDRELGKKFFGLLNKRLSEEEKFKSMAAYGIIDYLILVFFILYAFKNFYFAKDDGVVWCMIGGILPDLLVAIYILTKTKLLEWFFKFHRWNHYLLIGRMKNDIPLKTGIAMQIIIFLILLLLLNQINLTGPFFPV